MPKPQLKKRPPELKAQTLTLLYRTMLRIRRAEEKISEIYPTDKIQSPIHLCVGQEAVSAGVCLAMKRSDHLYGTYRSHGIYLAKGGGMSEMFAELFGKDTGCSGGKGGSMHLIAPQAGLMGCSAIVASTIPLAVGDALAAKMQGSKRVAAAFFGDGALSEGVFYESLNFASLKKLPVIFVCENNNYAVHSRVSGRHAQTKLYRYGDPFGIPGRRYDGNDAVIVYTSMQDAVSYARSGRGPVLIEYMTYRLSEHVGPGQDHQETYREAKKLEHAQKHDPLPRLEKFLRNKYKVSDKLFLRCRQEIAKEIDRAVAFAEKSPAPDPKRLFEHLYAEK